MNHSEIIDSFRLKVRIQRHNHSLGTVLFAPRESVLRQTDPNTFKCLSLQCYCFHPTLTVGPANSDPKMSEESQISSH